MTTYEVTDQAALDTALATAKPDDLITCIGSGSFTVEGSATVWAWDSATVRASKYVVIHIVRRPSGNPTVSGGVQIEVPPIDTPEAFCDVYGISSEEGIVTFYKAVDDDYSTLLARQHGLAYVPSTSPEAPDWSPAPVCGGGIHLSPRPAMARRYNVAATRYVACPVRLDEIVVVEPGYGADKVKAPRIAGPIVEVDIDGEPIGASA